MPVIRTDDVARAELIADLVGYAEPKLQYAGWVAACVATYPESSHPVGPALLELDRARYALDLAEALSRPARAA